MKITTSFYQPLVKGVKWPHKVRLVNYLEIRGKMKCTHIHSVLNPTQLGYNPYIDQISHLHLIYQEMGFKGTS